MPHFVMLLRYTQQGIAKIKESPARLDAAKKAAEKAGGKVHAWYLTMGQYDAVLISEFPNHEAGANFALSVGALGNVTTETLKALTETEYRKIVGGLSGCLGENSLGGETSPCSLIGLFVLIRPGAMVGNRTRAVGARARAAPGRNTRKCCGGTTVN